MGIVGFLRRHLDASDSGGELINRYISDYIVKNNINNTKLGPFIHDNNCSYHLKNIL